MERDTWKENIKLIVLMISDPLWLIIVDYLLYLILVKNCIKKIATMSMTEDVMMVKNWKKLSLIHPKSRKLLPTLHQRSNAITSLIRKKPKKALTLGKLKYYANSLKLYTRGKKRINDRSSGFCIFLLICTLDLLKKVNNMFEFCFWPKLLTFL